MVSASTGGKDQSITQLGRVAINVVSSPDLLNGSTTNKTHTEHTLYMAYYHAELRAAATPASSGYKSLRLQVLCRLGLVTCSALSVLLSIFNAANVGNGCSYSCTARSHAWIHRLHSPNTRYECQAFNSSAAQTASCTRCSENLKKTNALSYPRPTRIPYTIRYRISYTIRC